MYLAILRDHRLQRLHAESDIRGRVGILPAECFDDSLADRLASYLPDCDCLRFSGSAWYKFTKKEATKENAILKACAICGIALEDVTAFGDDAPDIGMLKLCGTGVAMGNAIDSVKEAADIVIGSNDEDGIAKYLEQRSKSSF